MSDARPKDKEPAVFLHAIERRYHQGAATLEILTGASIGVVGRIAGFMLGLVVWLKVDSIRQFLSGMTRTELFSPELYFLSRLPAELDVSETTAVVMMALILSLLATLYPSWRAARLDPVEALRYE